MTRKWTALTVTALSTGLLLSGLAMAEDKESPLGKVMEKVQANHTAILKTYRTPVAWKKDQKKAVTAAEDLAKLGKEAKSLGEATIKEKKKTQADWDEKMDAFVKEAEDFAKAAANPAMSNVEAKKAYSKVSATCTACHVDYREEE